MKKGTLFLLVGNSASGKDSLIKYVTSKISSLNKIKRFITREPSNSEDFISISEDDFIRKNFFLSWDAYNKSYGISRDVLTGLESGKNYIINISRDVIQNALSKWKNSFVIECVTSVKVIKQRLLNRAREDITEIEKRVQRALSAPILNPDLAIDTSNSDVSKAGEEIVEFVRKQLNL